jgi:lipopolysaccharide exporter
MSVHRGRSVATKAARGAAWTIATGVGSRGLGLVGTLVLTYLVARDELGEVSDAAIAVLLVNQLSTLGAGQYYVSRPMAGRDVAWHATFLHVSLGAVALLGLLALRHSVSVWMKAPSLGHFLPGLLLSALLERLAYMPERVLARQMRFRKVGLCRTAGEIAYTVASVTLALFGWGGMSIVMGNVVRSVVRFVMMSGSVPAEDWLSRSPFSWKIVRAMLRFGLPMSVGMGAGFASRRVDNAIVSSLFGAHVVGAYNLAYNVADAPAVQVGEQIGDVLLPSFSVMTPIERKEALLRSTALLALVTFPLAVGLGSVATSLVGALLRPEWNDVGPMVLLLSAMSVVRPVGWTISSYLLARDNPRLDAVLEVLKLVSLVALLLTLGRRGPLWACLSVGLAFAVHAAASMAVLQVLDGVAVAALLAKSGPPLAACIPMVASVVATRLAFAQVGMHPSVSSLVVEITIGAVTYVASAAIIARSASQDLVGLLRGAWEAQRNKG